MLPFDKHVYVCFVHIYISDFVIYLQMILGICMGKLKTNNVNLIEAEDCTVCCFAIINQSCLVFNLS